MKTDIYIFTLSSGWRSIRLIKVETDTFLPCHLVEDLFRLVKVDIYFPTLSSGWRLIRHMKVKTYMFLSCHLVGDLLDI